MLSTYNNAQKCKEERSYDKLYMKIENHNVI